LRPREVNMWSVREIKSGLAEELSKATGLSAVLCRILAGRGLTTSEAILKFIEPNLSRDWLDPSLIPGMSKGVRRIASAIARKERIVVFGDFDLDGIASAALLARGLAAYGADVEATVPNRFVEGYGLSATAIERVLALRPNLLVTVDCGVSAAAEIAEIRAAGVDVVVSDHHEPGASVPSGVPVVNPKLDFACESFSLAGAGVALKLLQGTGLLLGDEITWRTLTDLAALGTVADVVPLIGENRALVADGIERIRTSPREGLLALSAVAGVQTGTMRSREISYFLAPRLNAAGRMGDPEVALALLMSDDPGECARLANILDEQNSMRQAVEQQMCEEALVLAERHYRRGDRALVLASEGWHEGVKGIVASRLSELYGVPSVLFAVSEGMATGSGRSVGSIDLHAAVSACSRMVDRFGGHAAAVGVTLALEAVEGFRECLLQYLATLPDERFIIERTCDAAITLKQASVDLGEELLLLEPFGHGNPAPLFAANGVFMTSRKRVGKVSNHLRFTAFDGVTGVEAIAFRCRDIERVSETEAPVNLAFELDVDSWRGRHRAQLLVRELEFRPVSDYAPAKELVEELFLRADDTIVREEYCGIADAESFHTKLAGVTFEGRQNAIGKVFPGMALAMRRQPDNPHDANAIALFDFHGHQVGFLNRRLVRVLAPAVDAGIEYDVEVTDVTGGEDGRFFGVNVLVTRRSESDDQEMASNEGALRERFRSLSAEELRRRLVAELIGDGELLEAQRATLEALERGERCLTVMATGRGKSLIFHLHAAMLALREQVSSVFLFPLRALVSDQHYHLSESFSRIGLSVRALTGETPPSQRDEAFADLSAGNIAAVLTTPEFFVHHAERFASMNRVGFIVVDEAHHIGAANQVRRPAYLRLAEAIAKIGASPRVLAVTATASDKAVLAIRATLKVTTVICDPAIRDNLVMEDRRDIRDKDGYLCALVTRGEKTIIYASSREQTVKVARMLRKRVPEAGFRVAFYNGGLGKAARRAVERAFRDDELSVIVATSAFGEGVNIASIRNVVLYNLPFNETEFNQMSGRAGRDGALAHTHLLFGKKDGRINELVLSAGAPGREEMAACYLVLKEEQQAHGEGFEMTNTELARRVAERTRRREINDRAVSTAMGVFRELALVRTEGHGPYRRITVVTPAPGKLELTQSVLYAEGLREIEEFAHFRQWALGASPLDLLVRVNQPILPSTG